MRQLDRALGAYEQLEALGATPAEELPAGLLAGYGRCLVLRDLGRSEDLRREAAALESELGTGKWRLTQAEYEFYRDQARGWQPSRADPEPAEPQRREALLGNWGTSAVYGSVLEQGTGEYQRVSGYGTSYSFRPDGTFTYLMVGSGTVVSGAVTYRGTFKTRGNQLILHVTASAWTPMPGHEGQRAAWDWKPQDRIETHTWSITRRDDGQEQLTVDDKGLHRE